MEFQKKLKTRLYVAVSYIVLGLILISADVLNHFQNSFFSSYGIALMLMGILRILRHRKITKDEKTMRKQELMEKDERLQMMSERARSWAFSFSVILAGLAVIVLSLLGYHDHAQPLAWYVCGMVILYWIFWLILGKKY